MSYILNIETSTNVCSVSISNKEHILFEQESVDGPSHASLLGVFVENSYQYLRDHNLNLSAVAVSCGPGSYTGLRIGVSEAKGLCYGANIPLIAIQSLEVLAQKAILEYPDLVENALLCPMIDARRMEVYAALYDKNLKTIRDVQADIVDENTYKQYLESNRILFFGNGALKCEEAINSNEAQFIENIYPSARDMALLSNKAFLNKEFVDVAYFEPFYLKDFVATTPKKNIL